MATSNDSFFLLDVDDDVNGPVIHALTPSSVMVVHDADDLQRKLEQFEDPHSDAIPKSKEGRRWYVERVRPALRFYCKRYGVDVPDWLSSDEQWEVMSEEEKLAKFGRTDLKVRDFMKLNFPDIQVQRDEDEQEQP